MFVLNDKIISVKPYTIGELALLYEVDYRTLKKWLVPFEDLIGIKIGRFYNVKQILIIFENVKVPCKIVVDNLVDDNLTMFYDPNKNAFVLMPKSGL